MTINQSPDSAKSGGASGCRLPSPLCWRGAGGEGVFGRTFLRRQVAPAILFALIVLSAAGVRAQQRQTYHNETGVIYLGNSQVLVSLVPRLLTANAHVAQFLCAPTGTRVAYLSVIRGEDTVDESVGVVTPESGDDTVYYRDQGQRNFSEVDLDGWSDDAAYLAFQTQKVVGDLSNPSNIALFDDLQVVDLVHGKLIDVPVPYDQLVPPATAGEPPQRLLGGNAFTAVWAPGIRLLAIGLKTNPGEWGICLFDPDRDTCQVLVQDPGSAWLDGWQDATHIVYHSRRKYYAYDLATGKSAPVAANIPMARRAAMPSDSLHGGTTVPGPDKETLTVSSRIEPQTDNGQVDGSAETLWVTRTGGPPKLSKMEIDSFLPIGNGESSGVQFLSNGGFDTRGVYHVVYLDEGDLKVVDILPRGANAGEKLAAGEKLTCQDEIPIVENDAKQVGLGILQWVQDNHETFPPGGDGFHDEVYPYIKSDEVFTSPNGEHFSYLAPASPKLADMQDPMNTPLGEFDLPCSKVILYGDGHVATVDKDSQAP